MGRKSFAAVIIATLSLGLTACAMDGTQECYQDGEETVCVGDAPSPETLHGNLNADAISDACENRTIIRRWQTDSLRLSREGSTEQHFEEVTKETCIAEDGTVYTIITTTTPDGQTVEINCSGPSC